MVSINCYFLSHSPSSHLSSKCLNSAPVTHLESFVLLFWVVVEQMKGHFPPTEQTFLTYFKERTLFAPTLHSAFQNALSHLSSKIKI